MFEFISKKKTNALAWLALGLLAIAFMFILFAPGGLYGAIASSVGGGTPLGLGTAATAGSSPIAMVPGSTGVGVGVTVAAVPATAATTSTAGMALAGFLTLATAVGGAAAVGAIGSGIVAAGKGAGAGAGAGAGVSNFLAGAGEALVGGKGGHRDRSEDNGEGPIHTPFQEEAYRPPTPSPGQPGATSLQYDDPIRPRRLS